MGKELFVKRTVSWQNLSMLKPIIAGSLQKNDELKQMPHYITGIGAAAT